jgi:hypothetical protein
MSKSFVKTIQFCALNVLVIHIQYETCSRLTNSIKHHFSTINKQVNKSPIIFLTYPEYYKSLEHVLFSKYN